MATFYIMQEGHAWVWRLFDGDQGLAQGILYGDPMKVQRDLRLVCEGSAPPTVFRIAPGKWGWAFARHGQRLGTTMALCPTRDDAFEACVAALAAGEAAAQGPWVWLVDDADQLVPRSGENVVIRGPSSSRAIR